MVYIFTLLLGTIALTSGTAIATEETLQVPLSTPTPTASPYDCSGTNQTDDTTYICGDWRLGPVQMPTIIPVNVTTVSFKRYGGLCPKNFLEKYWNVTERGGKGGWNYPPMDGFVPITDGGPLNGTMVLLPGTLVDRYGSPTGNFIAPFSSPFEQRGLPPSNLNPPPKNTSLAIPEIYWVYEVKKPLIVSAGTIAPWFEQPGLGTQFKLSKSVQDLQDSGFLKWRPWREIFGDVIPPASASTQGIYDSEETLEL